MTNQKGLTQILSLGLIVAIVLAVISFAYIKYIKPEKVEKADKVIINANKNENANSNANVNLNINTNIAVNTNTTVNANTSVGLTGSETTSIDNTWNRYTNHDFGFYINIPKQVWFYYGSCNYSTEDGDHSYRPSNARVPVKTFEGDNSVHIAQEYFYELGGETREGGRSYFSECDITNNTFDLLSAERRTWHLKTATVRNDTELANFINENYGTGGCGLGVQTESELQAGVYDVSIEGDGLEPPETACFINYATEIKYYPAGNRVVAWDLGQDYSFWAIDSLTYTHDTEFFEYDTNMRESFRFIE